MLSGKWNVQILTAEWMALNVLEAKEITVQAELTPQTTLLKYLHQDLIIIPKPDRLIIALTKCNDQCLTRAEKVALKTVEILEHTPVEGVGINFAFDAEDATEILNLAKFGDSDKLLDNVDKQVQTEITRRYQIGETQLNLKIIIGAESATRAHFNFHRSVKNAKEAADCLKNRAVGLLEKATQLLDIVYDFQFQQEEVSNDTK